MHATGGDPPARPRGTVSIARPPLGPPPHPPGHGMVGSTLPCACLHAMCVSRCIQAYSCPGGRVRRLGGVDATLGSFNLHALIIFPRPGPMIIARKEPTPLLRPAHVHEGTRSYRSPPKHYHRRLLLNCLFILLKTNRNVQIRQRFERDLCDWSIKEFLHTTVPGSYECKKKREKRTYCPYILYIRGAHHMPSLLENRGLAAPPRTFCTGWCSLSQG